VGKGIPKPRPELLTSSPESPPVGVDVIEVMEVMEVIQAIEVSESRDRSRAIDADRGAPSPPCAVGDRSWVRILGADAASAL
jgi:hypothetical protein